MEAGVVGRRLLASPAGTPLLDLAASLLNRKAARGPLVALADRMLCAYLHGGRGNGGGPNRLERERILIARSILSTVDRLARDGALSPHLTRVITRLWARALLVPASATGPGREFVGRYGCEPPWFIAVSPGHACNLTCSGCYAGSLDGQANLSWKVFDQIISQARRLWGIKLVVISGGEPLAYRSEGKDVLDVVESHPDCLFLMFTNGTLIDDQVAARMERLGNLTPALSVEGMRPTTDERRGQGVFDRVLDSMSRLREAGVPVGISATVSRDNCEELMSDEFLDYFFYRKGAFYGFLFQYMPIGREPDLDLMPTPRQRLELWRRSWEVIAEKKIFLFDFWNHGTLVNGCVSAGRERGYMHFDWDGLVMPCVFAPYSVGNVNDIFTRGGDLNQLWEAPFFEAIRRWQSEYGYGNGGPSREANWLRPCPARDHFGDFSEIVARYGPTPADTAARDAETDEEYLRGLVSYGQELARLSQGIWEDEYL